MLDRCLTALDNQTYPHEVILVAQGEEDGSRAMAEDKHPRVQLLSFPDNAGFAGGVNRGIRPALDQGFEFIVLLNNDAEPDPDWLKYLAEAAEQHPDAGIVTSKILEFDRQHLDSTGDFYTSWGFAYPRGRGEIDSGQYDGEDAREIFSGSGGASLYRAEMLRDIGLFDEAFFAYFEDVDISFRAQLAGWKVRFEPRALVLHKINATSSKMKGNFARFHTIKNFSYLYTKNMPGWLYWKYLPKFWTAYTLFFLRDLSKLRLGTFFSSSIVALGHFPAMLMARWRIQSRRRVSAGYIDEIIEHQMPPSQRKVLAFKSRLGRAK